MEGADMPQGDAHSTRGSATNNVLVVPAHMATLEIFSHIIPCKIGEQARKDGITDDRKQARKATLRSISYLLQEWQARKSARSLSALKIARYNASKQEKLPSKFPCFSSPARAASKGTSKKPIFPQESLLSHPLQASDNGCSQKIFKISSARTGSIQCPLFKFSRIISPARQTDVPSCSLP